MIKSVLVALTLLVGAFCLVGANPALADSGPSGTSTRLEARMRAGGVEAKVSYRQKGSIRSLEAEIQRAQPLTAYVVTYQGRVLGQITTTALGAGRFQIVDGGDNPGQSKIPAMSAGDGVGVGTMAGTLAAR